MNRKQRRRMKKLEKQCQSSSKGQRIGASRAGVASDTTAANRSDRSGGLVSNTPPANVHSVKEGHAQSRQDVTNGNQRSGLFGLVRLDEVAAFLGMSRRTVYRLIAEQKLPQPVKIGSATRLDASEVLEYVEQLKRERSRREKPE